jgi:hypothetical protein
MDRTSGVESSRYGSATSPSSPICCRTTKLPLTRSLAVERVIGTGAAIMLSCRCGGTEARVARSYLHPVSSNQERQFSAGPWSYEAARATFPGTALGIWTFKMEAAGAAGDPACAGIASARATGDPACAGIATEIAGAAAAGFLLSFVPSPFPCPPFFLGEALRPPPPPPPCLSRQASPNLQVPAAKKVHCFWLLSPGRGVLSLPRSVVWATLQASPRVQVLFGRRNKHSCSAPPFRLPR